MTIVVTGTTGKLGRLIVESLIERGVSPDEIVAAGRSIDRLADLADRGVRLAAIDYDDSDSLDAAFAGADKVMLVSGTDFGQRASQHGRVVEAAKRADVSHIVYTSAPKADTSALILAPEHKATEEIIRASGVPFTILRNSWYTENYVDQVALARQTGTIVASVGDGLVASASRHDYAEAAAAVLSGSGHEGETYELSGDSAWHFSDLAAAASTVLARDVVYSPVSPEEHAEILTGAGLDEATAGFVVAIDGDTRAGLLADTSGDLRRLIGRPTTSLVDALAAAV